MWCVPRIDKVYTDRMENILELYERPYNAKEPVICLDERPVVLRSDKRARHPVKPGKSARYDYEYERRGTANIFCAVEPLAGVHISRVTKNRKAPEFAKVMASIARKFKDASTIHLVMDNLSTHSMSSLERFYGEEESRRLWSKFTVHYTPVHASWLNMAEIEIGLLSRQCLGTRRFSELKSLRKEVNAWNARINRDKTRISWKYNRVKARKDFRYSPTTVTATEH